MSRAPAMPLWLRTSLDSRPGSDASDSYKSTPRRAATLERSDRPFAAPPVTLVPAAVDWPARVAHRYAAATRRHPLPGLSDHGLVPGCRTHRSLPGDTAHFARALRRSDRR